MAATLPQLVKMVPYDCGMCTPIAAQPGGPSRLPNCELTAASLTAGFWQMCIHIMAVTGAQLAHNICSMCITKITHHDHLHRHHQPSNTIT